MSEIQQAEADAAIEVGFLKPEFVLGAGTSERACSSLRLQTDAMAEVSKAVPCVRRLADMQLIILYADRCG